jgi:anti-anti-sigma factor
MNQRALDLLEESAAGVTIVRLTGRIDSGTASELAHALGRLLLGTRPRVVLDLGAVEHLSGAGLRVLVSASRGVAQRDPRGMLVLCGLSRKLSEVLAISGVDTALTHCPSRAEAVAWALAMRN